VIVPKYSADSSFQRHAEHVREQLAFCLPSMDDQGRLTDTQFPGKCLRTYLTVFCFSVRSPRGELSEKTASVRSTIFGCSPTL